MIDDEVVDATCSKNGVLLTLENSGEDHFSFVWLATGSQHCLPEKHLVTRMVEKEHLPCAPCGFPIVDKQLEWKDGLYVSGALAELEVGPAARNIVGVKKVAEKLVLSTE